MRPRDIGRCWRPVEKHAGAAKLDDDVARLHGMHGLHDKLEGLGTSQTSLAVSVLVPYGMEN
jgi:hypothetical protein